MPRRKATNGSTKSNATATSWTPLDRSTVKLFDALRLRLAHKYPAIAEVVVALDARRAYPDGEPRARGADGIYLTRVARTSVMSSKTIASRPTMRKVCRRKGEETFAGTHGSDGVAP